MRKIAKSLIALCIFGVSLFGEGIYATFSIKAVQSATLSLASSGVVESIFVEIGDKIAFCDMMHYTIVKNTTFNGIELPSLCVVKNNTINLLKQFDYLDFKERN